ncbi:hypothetical protein ACNKF0_10500 [Nocardioides sp. T5]|uniref:hypothetical protein n=1 Tax=Nocardioides sp. T5 TaxID=3400182 RepID=UPI003A87FF19
MTTERDAIEKVRTTFAMLDEHRARWGDVTQSVPEPGSALDLDDRTWPSLPLSQMGWQGMVCAWDHFDLARFTIDHERGFPTAVYSVLRGALLASSQALWALGPDDSATRVERGLILAQEWYRRRIQWQESLTTTARQGALYVATDVMAPEDVGRSVLQLKELEKDLASVEELRSTREQMEATRCVKIAAEFAAVRTGASALTSSAPREWQRLGGDAHGLGWPLMMQTTTWGERGADGLTAATVTVDLVTLANSYLCAWLVYTAAVGRFNEIRAGATTG